MMEPIEKENKLEMLEGQESSTSVLSVFRLRNFRLLWIGQAISVIGDQFHLIALPWLVLQLTGDALAMGTVLALAAVPRAVFMLVGGVMSDRLSPRMVMLISNLLRMILVFLLAVPVLSGTIEMWMIYVLALLFGLADAFFYPAQNAIVPRLVDDSQLQPANAVMQGTWQLSLFAGPVVAGMLISTMAGDPSMAGAGNLRGIGIAFIIDALTFLASAVTLWFVDDGETAVESSDGEDAAGESLFNAIIEGLRIVWGDNALRAFFLLIAISNFLIIGPLAIGVPVLAATRFAGGATAYGVIMSAYGGGSLLGTIAAGLLPPPPGKRMGIVLGVIWSGLGLGILALGLISTTRAASAIALLMGIAEGYVVILFITWLQRRTAEDMLGRMMSLLAFASIGLQPLSNVITGALVALNATRLFVGFGALMIVLTLIFLLNPAVRSMESGVKEESVAITP
jgi:MFS family permease